MANVVYPLALQQMMSLMLTATNIKMLAVNEVGGTTQYVYSAAHTFVSDVTATTIVGRSGALTGLTFTGGVLNSAALTAAFPSLTGQQFESIIFYVDTGTGTTSRLLCHMDTATGLPLTPNGNNVDFTPNASGIFSI